MEVLLGIGIGTVLAFIITATHDMIAQRRSVKITKKTVHEPRTVEHKIAPFVEIHMEHMSRHLPTASEDSIDSLKQKIEGFKQRNRFYNEQN